MYIYKTTNKINGRIYIGLSTHTPHNHGHYLGSGKLLKQALKKYGRKNFTKEILEECSDLETLRKLEKKWIKRFRESHTDMYNLSDGGDCCGTDICKKRGFHGEGNPNYGNYWTDEQKERISIILKKSQHNKGKNNPSCREDVKEKIRKTKLGSKNHNSAKWKIIHPDGTEEIINGGIKRRLIELSVSYIRFPYVDSDGYRYGNTHNFRIKRLT